MALEDSFFEGDVKSGPEGSSPKEESNIKSKEHSVSTGGSDLKDSSYQQQQKQLQQQQQQKQEITKSNKSSHDNLEKLNSQSETKKDEIQEEKIKETIKSQINHSNNAMGECSVEDYEVEQQNHEQEKYSHTQIENELPITCNINEDSTQSASNGIKDDANDIPGKDADKSIRNDNGSNHCLTGVKRKTPLSGEILKCNNDHVDSVDQKENIDLLRDDMQMEIDGKDEDSTMERKDMKEFEKCNGDDIKVRNSLEKKMELSKSIGQESSLDRADYMPKMIRKLSEHRRSWHFEILTGLFLRCDEMEICKIDKDTRTKYPSLDHPRSRPKKRPRLSEHTHINMISNCHNGEPSQLPVFSEILKHFRGKGITNEGVQDEINSISVVKRNTYASRKIKQVEKTVENKFRERILKQTQFSYSMYGTPLEKTINHNQSKRKNSPPPQSVSSSDQLTKRDAILQRSPSNSSNNQQLFKPFTIMYNECSLAALSNWSLPPGSTTHATIDIDDLEAEGQTSSTTKTKEKRNTNLKRVSCHPVASATFRKCLICHNIGHYEVECDQLALKRTKKSLKTAKVLSNELRIQKILRDFASPFGMSLREIGYSIAHDESDADSDDGEAQHRIDVKQDLELLTKRKAEISSYPFISVGTDSNENIMSVRKNTNNSFINPILKKEDNDTEPENRNRDDGDENAITVEEVYDGCEICNSKYQAEDLLLCDGCDRLFHQECLDPPLEKLPEGNWFCRKCTSYDSDVSSVVEIEGLDGFVIEQRKLTTEEKSKTICTREKDMRIGYYENGWNVAVSTIPIDSEYIINNIAPNGNIDEQEEPELTLGELCFAKRTAPTATYQQAAFARDVFWPAMVMNIQKNNIAFDGSIQTKYIVSFFALMGSGRTRASKVLPFFQNFEELACNRIYQDKNEIWYPYFRRALDQALSKIGIHSISQAKTFARERELSDKSKNGINNEKIAPITESPPNSSNGKDVIECKDIDFCRIDNFVVVARPDGKNKQIPASAISQAQTTKVRITKQPIADSKKDSVLKPIEDLIGGVVAFTLDNINKEDRLNFGVLSSVDKLRRKVLVRVISGIDSMFKALAREDRVKGNAGGNIEDVFDDILSRIYSCKSGSSLWISIDSIIHLTTGPKIGEQNASSLLMKEALNLIRNEMCTDRDVKSKIREDLMKKLDSAINVDGHIRKSIKYDQDDEDRSSSQDSESSSSDIDSHCDELSSINSAHSDISNSTSTSHSSLTDNTNASSTSFTVKNNFSSRQTNGGTITAPQIDPSSSTTKDNDVQANQKVVCLPSKRSNNGTIFIVEAILNDRINKNGQKEYLIKWKGFNSTENTWEIEKNIIDKTLIDCYYKV